MAPLFNVMNHFFLRIKNFFISIVNKLSSSEKKTEIKNDTTDIKESSPIVDHLETNVPNNPKTQQKIHIMHQSYEEAKKEGELQLRDIENYQDGEKEIIVDKKENQNEVKTPSITANPNSFYSSQKNLIPDKRSVWDGFDPSLTGYFGFRTCSKSLSRL